MGLTVCVVLVSVAMCASGGQVDAVQGPLVGTWNASLDSAGGPIRFGIQINSVGTGSTADSFSGFLVNGPERIKIPFVQFDGHSGFVDIPHYDSRISFTLGENNRTLAGEWKKRRGVDKWSSLSFSATKSSDSKSPQSESLVRSFAGRWETQFKSDSDLSVAQIRVDPTTNRIVGTFLTTTGDYRYLDSRFNDGVLELSCFDGAHAFLFHIRKTGEETLEGDFWSSESWHDTFTGSRNDAAALPDAFEETKVAGDEQLGRLSFPDLDGKPTRLDDPKFNGRVRIIYVFGSWCPNCHDAAEYFAELNREYADRGLSILGLAFEHTGDFERDSNQVRRYLKRHDIDYPVLIAGLSDKKEASIAFPVLDRIRSYPTTIFLDSTNKIRAVHTGFSGPATGEDYEKLKHRFEFIIESVIRDSK